MSIERLVREDILRLQPYRCARDTIGEGLLLDANESPVERRWRGESLNRYPDPRQGRLRRALAGYLDCRPENVLAGTGSDEVIDWVLKVFCDPGRDAIALFEPTYGMYRVQAEIAGAKVQTLRLDAGFRLRAAAFLERVGGDVKVLFLCSPNNPTGNDLEREALLRIARDWPGLVVLDEAYVEFSRRPSLVPEALRLPNLLIMRTLSKAFGCAAIRLGYAVGPPEVIAWLARVKAPYNLSALSQAAALEVLQEADRLQGLIEQIRGERERVRRRLEELGAVSEVFPSDANFLLFRCRESAAVCGRLLERGIVIRDRGSAPGLAGCLRVTIGTREQNDRFLEALTKETRHVLTHRGG